MIATINSTQATDQHPILAKNSTFFSKKRTSQISTPQSVLHQNKALHNFHKCEQRLLAGHIRALYIYNILYVYIAYIYIYIYIFGSI